ncbi:MAG: MarR family transcriptional regulator [Holophagaceae bacterium]|nr:MarR family transcriptional regulator [Holophagaceae bacterium]
MALALEPKDLLVLLKLALSKPQQPWSYQRLAMALSLSASETFASVKRLLASGLLVGKGLKAEVNRKALCDFVLHGARYSFPAEIGKPSRGMPTGYASPALQWDLVFDPNQVPVWPDAKGKAKGHSLTPLHPRVPKIAQEDPMMYEALALFDALRAGQARERQMARARLEVLLG